MPRNLTVFERTQLIGLSLVDGDILALETTVGSKAAPGAEVTGGTYARKSIDWAASGGAATNAVQIQFTGITSGTEVKAWSVYDSTGSTRKWFGTLAPSIVVTGSTLTFAAGDLNVTIDNSTLATPPTATWNPATMLGSDQLHPNDSGMTYLADKYQSALVVAGATPAAGSAMTAYGDSWTASDTMNTVGKRAIHQLRDRLGLTLTNQAVNGYRSGDCAGRAIGTAGTFSAGASGIAVMAGVGLNDLLLSDTTQQRAATANYLRALMAVLLAAERIEQSSFTFAGTWANTANPNALFSGGNNAVTTTEGASATYTIATPGTYYLLTQGTNGGSLVGGKLTISQGATTLATIDLNAQMTTTGVTLTADYGPLAVRLDNVVAGTLTVTYSKNGRSGTVYGFLDSLVRIPATPRTLLAIKPVRVLASDHNQPALLGYIRGLYDTLAAEFGSSVVVCDPDPGWTP